MADVENGWVKEEQKTRNRWRRRRRNRFRTLDMEMAPREIATGIATGIAKRRTRENARVERMRLSASNLNTERERERRAHLDWRCHRLLERIDKVEKSTVERPEKTSKFVRSDVLFISPMVRLG